MDSRYKLLKGDLSNLTPTNLAIHELIESRFAGNGHEKASIPATSYRDPHFRELDPCLFPEQLIELHNHGVRPDIRFGPEEWFVLGFYDAPQDVMPRIVRLEVLPIQITDRKAPFYVSTKLREGIFNEVEIGHPIKPIQLRCCQKYKKRC